MQKVSRQILTETKWLAFSLGLGTLLLFFLFGRNFLSDSFDIVLHDSYYVIAPVQIVLPFFTSIIFIIYYIKEFRNSFRQVLPNWIIIIIGLILLVSLSSLISIFSQSINDEWTLYPPLSVLGHDKIPEFIQDPVAIFITNFLILLQVLVLTMLLFVTFRWGRQKQNVV